MSLVALQLALTAGRPPALYEQGTNTDSDAEKSPAKSLPYLPPKFNSPPAKPLPRGSSCTSSARRTLCAPTQTDTDTDTDK